MSQPLMIRLDEATTQRCIAAGKAQKQGYADGTYSTVYSSHGAEADDDLLSAAKMAECILAISLRLPVDDVFDAPPERPWDLRTKFGRLDCKQTGLHGRYLIWPLRKNNAYLRKDFDHLCLVKSDRNVGYAKGWLTKKAFYQKKQIAGPGHKLAAGTWHVDQAELEDMEDFPAFDAPSLEIQAATLKWLAKNLRKKLRASEYAILAERLSAALRSLRWLQ